MACFYHATSQKPTAVTASAVGAFTGGADINLVLAKTSRLDVYTVTSEGATPLIEVALNGRVATLKTIRLAVRACV